MCGIADILYRDRETPVDKDLLPAMTDVIRYRGLDGEGLHIAPRLGLRHRGLAIIDSATPATDAGSRCAERHYL